MSLVKSNNPKVSKKIKVETDVKAEVQKSVKNSRVEKVRVGAIKIACGLILVAFAFSGCDEFVGHYLRNNVSTIVAPIISALVIVVLAVKLAMCDSSSK